MAGSSVLGSLDGRSRICMSNPRRPSREVQKFAMGWMGLPLADPPAKLNGKSVRQIVSQWGVTKGDGHIALSGSVDATCGAWNYGPGDKANYGHGGVVRPSSCH